MDYEKAEKDNLQAYVERLKKRLAKAEDLLKNGGDTASVDFWPHDVWAVFSLVDHGYEVNFYSGDDEHLGFVCRDFGGNYDEEDIKRAVVTAVKDMMENLERKYLDKGA